MALHIIDEANRCLNCKKPMCQQGCPVHTPIPLVIQLFKENRLMEAGDMLFRNNPMSAVCSIVCNHEMQCAGHCIRGKKDTPVHFSSIENYISEMYLDRMEVNRPEKKDKKVAVIGCGPAGIDELFRDGYASIFIGTGAEKPRSLGIEGESFGNVLFGLNYLANPKGHRLGDRVAVIGMGNAAMDVARTALRNGSRHVTLYARSRHVTASSHELQYAELDGAEFVYGMQIQKITEKGPVFRRSIFDEDNHVIGYEDELIQEEADSTIISISQVPRAKLVRTTHGLELGENGLLPVDENCMTTREGVFSAGDVVTGAKTVVHAVEGAKRAAEAMVRYMERE